ncbi:hypothetical protein [Sulfurimonas sp.]|uniref:hypothetical protein n=1 Tax=Sulfurimonas sp. TaxID=2022749 RepID=UPI0025E18E48|nr:hypothetical protein [Sulfurimonas sp.]MDD5156556.1 hypothetical protein [Sulfurimonas sp.]
MNFKLITEEFLQSIDTFFRLKSQKDVKMIYIMIVFISAAISYPFYDLSLDKFKIIKERVDTLSAKIEVDKNYLLVNTEAKIAMLKQEIIKAKDEILITKNNNQYIKGKIETISSLIYDERTWGEYLHSISINAVKHNVKIVAIKNKYVDSNTSFGHILDITIDATGKHSDTLNFINSLEQSELVVDLHDFNISAEDKLKSRLDISVWGITY